MDILEINGRPKKVYKLTESGVTISSFTNPHLPTEEHIKFENIRADRFYYAQKTYQYLIAGGILLILLASIAAASAQDNTSPAIVYILLSIGLITSILLFFLHQPKVYFLKTFTGKFIKFRVTGNEKEIDAFVNAVITRRNEYLKLKYGVPNKYLSYDAQYSNFSIMLKEDIFKTSEYQEKIEELNKLFSQSAPTQTFIGYSQN